MSERWTDETAKLTERAIDEWFEQWNGDPEPNREVALAVLAVLADTGLLVQPGSAKHTEWGSHGGALGWQSEAAARREVAEGKGPLMSRTVHVGPWIPVPCEHGARWAPPPVDGVRTWYCRSCTEAWTEPVS